MRKYKIFTGVKRAVGWVILITVLMIGFGPVAMAVPAGWMIIKLTDGSSYAPQISGSNVVWVANDSSGCRQIFFYDYDSNTITQLTDNGYWDLNPKISGSNVVWEGHGAYDCSSDSGIFFYNGDSNTITQLTNNSYSSEISGSNVIWVDSWVGTDYCNHCGIVRYDGSTITRLTDSSWCSCICSDPCPINPQISGSNIVWLGCANDTGCYEIFFYNGDSSTITQLTHNCCGINAIPDDPTYGPRISGSNAVWVGLVNDDHDLDRYEHYEIFLYNGSTVTQLTNNNHPDYNPRISGSNVVWQSFMESDWVWQIFFYNGDSSTITQLTHGSYYGSGSWYRDYQISGSNVVWSGNDDSGYSQIFFYNSDSNTITQLTDYSYDNYGPQISGSNVVWANEEGIFMAVKCENPGDCWPIVPNVVGMHKDDACSEIVAATFDCNISDYDFNDTVPADHVISQNPPIESRAFPGTSITLVVSGVIVPNVVNLPLDDANQAIIDANLIVGERTPQHHNVVPSDNVISQNPVAGTIVPLGSAVNMVVSLGLPIVPDVVNLPLEQASATIIAAGFNVGAITYEHNDIIAQGNVISQNPIAGSRTGFGTDVNLVVSAFPVPDVIGMYICDAISTITDSGLVVSNISYKYDNSVLPDYVISQNPPAETYLLVGLSINLVVSTDQPVDTNSNLLRNPGFEEANPCDSNKPKYWDFAADNDANMPVYHDTGGHNGGKYVGMTVYEYGIGAYSVCYQHRNIAEQIPYTLKAWIKKGPMLYAGQAELKIEFKDWNYGLIDQNTALYNVTANWAQYTLDSMLAPEGTRLVACTVSSGSVATASIDLCFDDVNFTTNPPDSCLDDCQLAQFDPDFNFSAGDLNHDCIVDFYDLAQFADNWLGNCFFECGADIYPTEGECIYSYDPNQSDPNSLGLVSLWKFDEGSGNIAYDSFGNNDGTIHGATRVKGACGNALSFDGTNDYVEMQPFGLSEVTIAAWVRIWNSSVCNPIFWRCGPTDISVIYGLQVTSSGALSGYCRYNLIDSNDSVVSRSVWTHVAMTYDGNSVKLYKNGELIKTGIVTCDINDNSGKTYIGHCNIMGVCEGYWQGQIDEVAVYNRALNQQEIQSQIYGERDGIVNFEDFAVLAEEWLKKSD